MGNSDEILKYVSQMLMSEQFRPVRNKVVESISTIPDIDADPRVKHAKVLQHSFDEFKNFYIDFERKTETKDNAKLDYELTIFKMNLLLNFDRAIYKMILDHRIETWGK